MMRLDKIFLIVVSLFFVIFCDAKTSPVSMKMLAVDISGNTPFTSENIKSGKLYVLGQYKDLEALSRQGTAVVTSPADFVPLTDPKVLSQYDVNQDGTVRGVELYHSRFTLAHYNAQGQWVVQQLNAFRVETVDVNETTGKVELLTLENKTYPANWVEVK